MERVFAAPRMAGGLKVPKRRENEQHRHDGGDQAVTTEFADKAQLQVYEVHRRNGAHGGVKDRTQAQALRERLENETHRQCEHVQKIDEAEIRHRHAEDARIRAVHDGVASVEDRTPQRLAGVVPVRDVERSPYADERKREHGVGWKGDLPTPGSSSRLLRRVCHRPIHAGPSQSAIALSRSRQSLRTRFDLDQVFQLFYPLKSGPTTDETCIAAQKRTPPRSFRRCRSKLTRSSAPELPATAPQTCTFHAAEIKYRSPKVA